LGKHTLFKYLNIVSWLVAPDSQTSAIVILSIRTGPFPWLWSMMHLFIYLYCYH